MAIQKLERGLQNIKGIGVTDWNLGPTDRGIYEGTPAAFKVAERLGFDGVQVSIGWNDVTGGLKLGDADLRRKIKNSRSTTGVEVTSLRLDQLQVESPVSADARERARAQQLLADAIPIAQDMGTKVVLVPFFGDKATIRTSEQMYRVADVLADVAPDAERAGVVFGLENTLSAEDNRRLMDRVGNFKAIGVYYDVGNSYKFGYDVPGEIRNLGRDGLIAEIHYKDNTNREMKLEPRYLDEARFDMYEVTDVLLESGYTGWVNLETMSPRETINPAESTGDNLINNQLVIEEDLVRNLRFVRQELFNARAEAA